VAWVLAGLTGVFCVADVVVTAQYRPLLSEAAVAEHGFPFVNGAVLGSAVLGAVIIARYERHAIGWLLNLIGFTGAFSLLTEAYGIWVVSEGGPGSRSLAGVSGWLSSLVGGQLAIGGLALMFLLAPDGQFLSRRWRYVAAVPAVGVLFATLALLATNPTTFDLQSRDTGLVRGLLFTLGFLMICIGLVASGVSMVLRLKRSRGEARQQVRLIALSAVLVAIGIVSYVVVQAINGGRQSWAASLPLFVAYLLLPVLFTIAVLRYRLYDIELIVNRTVVVALGTGFAGIGYTTLVVTVGKGVDRQTSGFWLSLLATALVALAFQPVRRWVIRFANRLAYGSRAQPYEALSDFSSRLAETPSQETLLPAVADAAGRAVSARRAVASLEVPGVPTMSADWGRGDAEGTDAHVVEVRTGGTRLGTIAVWIPKGRPLRPSDIRLLTALSDQAAVAFRNVAMESQLARHVAELDHTTHELSASRSRIIEADDAARRTLEEAISREVLPHLIALPGELVSARQAVAFGSPANGVDLLVAATNQALESLRELTRGVFPTQLARSGVEPALRSLLARNGLASALHVGASAAGQRFSPRVEAAVYFCCAEASRSASSLSSVELSVTADDLVLEVAGVSAGDVDLRAIGDRVGAVAGSVTAEPALITLTIPVESATGRGPGL
jgi:N-terminal 7TM region of histidine kinase